MGITPSPCQAHFALSTQIEDPHLRCLSAPSVWISETETESARAGVSFSPIVKKEKKTMPRKRAVEKERERERGATTTGDEEQGEQAQCAFLPWCLSRALCSSTTRRKPAIGRAARPRGMARRRRRREKRRWPTSSCRSTESSLSIGRWRGGASNIDEEKKLADANKGKS